MYEDYVTFTSTHKKLIHIVSYILDSKLEEKYKQFM